MKRIIVNLSDQILFAYEGKEEVYKFDCATGDKDHPTDPGTFRIFKKNRVYRSKKYDAQMDFAMFFTKDGKAIHKSNFVGPISLLKSFGMDSLGSHGCVRLAGDDANKLFDWATMGTIVEIKSL